MLPVHEKNLVEFYKLMKVKGGITQEHVIFSITLPLVEHDKFKLYNLIPIPTAINNTMLTIEVCSPILAIDINRRHYLTVSLNQFKSCSTLNDDLFICYNTQLEYNFGADKCSCEISLFNNVTKPSCNIKRLSTNLTWTPLRHNQWIYALSSPAQVTVVCGKEITTLYLEGSGHLSINPECIIKHDFIHLIGQQSISTSTGLSYTGLATISELSYQHLLIDERTSSINHTLMTNQMSTQLNKLEGLQQ